MNTIKLTINTNFIKAMLAILLLINTNAVASETEVLMRQMQQTFTTICEESVIASLRWKDKKWLPEGRVKPEGFVGSRTIAIRKVSEASDKTVWDLCQQEMEFFGERKDNYEEGVVYGCYDIQEVGLGLKHSEYNTGMCKEKWKFGELGYSLVEINCNESFYSKSVSFNPSGEIFIAKFSNLSKRDETDESSYKSSAWLTAGSCNLIEGNPNELSPM